MKTRNQAESALRLFAAIVCVMAAQLSWSFFHQFSDIRWIPDIVQFSLFMWRDFSVVHTTGEMILTGITVINIVSFIVIVIKDSLDHFRWNRFLTERIDQRLTKQWNRKFSALGAPIIVIEEPHMLAMTSGVIQPRIIMTTGLIRGLDEEELTAVLLHEGHHAAYRHPIKKWFLQRVARVMFYIPVLRTLSNYYAIWIELLADRAAIEAMKDTTPIASALVKLINQQGRAGSYIGVDFAKTAVNFRLKQILDPDERQRILPYSRSTLWLSLLAGSLVTGVVFFSCL